MKKARGKRRDRDKARRDEANNRKRRRGGRGAQEVAAALSSSALQRRGGEGGGYSRASHCQSRKERSFIEEGQGHSYSRLSN